MAGRGVIKSFGSLFHLNNESMHYSRNKNQGQENNRLAFVGLDSLVCHAAVGFVFFLKRGKTMYGLPQLQLMPLTDKASQ